MGQNREYAENFTSVLLNAVAAKSNMDASRVLGSSSQYLKAKDYFEEKNRSLIDLFEGLLDVLDAVEKYKQDKEIIK